MRLALLLVAGMSMVSTGAIAQAQPDGMESTAVLALRHVKDAQTFVGLAGVYDLFIVQASEIALERSRHPRIRDFATAMIEAHRTSYDRLWKVVREERGPEPPRGIGNSTAKPALANASAGYGSICPGTCMNCGKMPSVTPPIGPPWQYTSSGIFDVP